jgi:hypothetical protein
MHWTAHLAKMARSAAFPLAFELDRMSFAGVPMLA